MTSGDELVVGERSFARGASGVSEVAVGHLITHECVQMPVHVRRGKRSGPRLFVCAAIHGDELNGVEIVRRLLKLRLLRRLRGDLLAVPVVNLPAFVARSRYLPDRRDLNRLFPGSSQGSFGARLARTFVESVARPCACGIDLHTGAVNRPNLPQLRITAGNAEAREMAQVFGVPVAIEASIREGSLRAYMEHKGKPLLTFEGGEALRLDGTSIRYGLRGVLNVMRSLGMLPPEKSPKKRPSRVIFSRSTYWARAPRGGTFTPLVPLGRAVTSETVLGFISDPFGPNESPLKPEGEGIVIGRTNLGIADEGDALFHIASTTHPVKDEATIMRTRAALEEEEDQPVSDEFNVD